MATLQIRPTLRDIGRKTGFHYSTISLALRGHPRIPEATKQIIREAAEGLGYWPDPMLSVLCAYRLTKRLPGQTGDRLADEPPHPSWLASVGVHAGLFRRRIT